MDVLLFSIEQLVGNAVMQQFLEVCETSIKERENSFKVTGSYPLFPLSKHFAIETVAHFFDS
jgi:hypothetical protein